MSKIAWSRVASETRFFAAAAAVFIAFQTAAYGMYYIPSESMLPTLAVGDRVAVSKFAYGYSRHSLPFSLGPNWPTKDGRVFSRLPARGEVVVFRHPRSGRVMIKRVVGLPGDEIAFVEGALIVNGVPAAETPVRDLAYREHHGRRVFVRQSEETLPGGVSHAVYDRGRGFPGDEFGPVVVPQGAIFVAGDNRDNSLDSRFGGDGVGMLPVDRLIGRAEMMVFSLNFCRPTAATECPARAWGSRL